MQIKHRKVLACLAMLAFCFSFLALPVAPADAASTYTVLTCPTVQTGTGVALGTVQIDIPNVAALQGTYDIITVSLPSGVELPGYTMPGALMGAGTLNQLIDVTAPANVASGAQNPLAAAGAIAKVKDTSSTSVDIYIETSKIGTTSPNGTLMVAFKSLNIQGITGDITATFLPPSGSGFTMGQAVIGKVSTSGGTMAAVKSVKTVSKSSNQKVDTIMIMETVPGTFKNGTKIDLDLPSGYEWNTANAVVAGSWSWDGVTNFNVAASGKKLTITFLQDRPAGSNTTGRINIGVQLNASGLGLFGINVPDSASNGDVSIDISGNGDISSSTIVVAKVGDYGITVAEDTKLDVKAGRIDQKLGSFIIEESLAGSLVENRSIRLTLPDGCKWTTNPTRELVSGDVQLGAWETIGTDGRTISTTITTQSSKATKIRFKDAKVQISPKFEGPVTITVAGTAGATGEVTVAESKLAVSLAPEKVENIILGLPSQPIADLVITENFKGALMDTNGGKIQIELDSGYTWATKPTVSVIEGNLEIDSYKLINNSTTLEIIVKSSSSKPSKIKISNVKLTALRYVPEGAIKASFVAGQNALDETTLWTTRESAGEAVIANCVTPAPIEQGRSAVFYIGSTVMNVNGSNVIMDAAPYIKAGRTYVPVRYLGDALGATTTWDAATKTVTITKEDKTVILVIGSKIAKVNGADVAMDVAPEITNGRTMLPARYVAEGLGYQVGWNATLQQVIIQ